MLGITLGTTPDLDQTLVNSFLGNNAVLSGDAGIDGIVGLDSDNYTLSDMYFENALPETMIAAGGIPDDITAAWLIFCIRITTHLGLSNFPRSKFILYNNYMIHQTGEK
jgi:hypothetical protein